MRRSPFRTMRRCDGKRHRWQARWVREFDVCGECGHSRPRWIDKAQPEYHMGRVSGVRWTCCKARITTTEALCLSISKMYLRAEKASAARMASFYDAMEAAKDKRRIQVGQRQEAL